MTYLFDGSFNGLLTCIFEAFSRKQLDISIAHQERFQPTLLEEWLKIESDSEKAKRVYSGIIEKLGSKNARLFYEAYLSEFEEIYSCIFRIVKRTFKGEINILENYGDAEVLFLTQTLKKVSRERHRMKAFTRFQKDHHGLFFALIEPDFNVLPLIESFFRKRYADQNWLIYDVKRKYGLLYFEGKVEEVKLSHELPKNSSLELQIEMDEQDALYQQLWKQYFKSTNIQARKNLKLHLQHVPKRYWKYLTEKQ